MADDASESGDGVETGFVTDRDDDDDTVLVRVPRGAIGAIGVGPSESVLVEPVPGEDTLKIHRRPICEWCGCYIDETSGDCPARDDGVGCDANPTEWYEKMFSSE